MSGPQTTAGAAESGIDAAIIEYAADQMGLDPSAIADALVVLHADLIGRHARYERTCEHVTVDGTRAYRVTGEEWDELLSAFDFAADVEAGVMLAHTEMAELLFAESVSGDDAFGPKEAGIVIGIDTAEQY